MVSILQEGGHFSGINRKAQLCLAWAPVPGGVARAASAEGKEPPSERVTEALLILKFGGVLTHLGKNQAEFLGRDFRMRMYPGPGGNYYDVQGNTDDGPPAPAQHVPRHDRRRFAPAAQPSDEGRVQITAAAFAKGLLDLETSNNQLTPILASLVNKDAKLLDFVTHEVEEDILHAKQKLYNIMTEGHVAGAGRTRSTPPATPRCSTTTSSGRDRWVPAPHERQRQSAQGALAEEGSASRRPVVPHGRDAGRKRPSAPKKPKGGSGSYALGMSAAARAR